MKDMYTNTLFLVIALLLSLNARGMADVQPITPQPEPGAFEGRWDLTFDIKGKSRPGWLEIKKSGNKTTIGYIMVMTGSARPISEIRFHESAISFVIPPQWEHGDDLIFEATLAEDQLRGKVRYSDGNTYPWKGVRAPALRKPYTPKWGKRINLFNGKDLSGWKTQNATDQNQWVVNNDILTSPKSGSNLMTEATFTDFKLHVEFRYPKNGNSGIYLRGRYEVQIADSKGMVPSNLLYSGVYGALSPSEIVAKDPGEWQTFDITLVDRLLTIDANGTTVICNQEITGITGGAIDSNEGEPGPILLQGDHEPVEFRKIVLRKARR